MPRLIRRGAGLANEIIPWAKAYLASAELGLRLLHPAWGLNPRRYWQLFGTSRLDWVAYRALEAVLPRVVFSEDAYWATGEDDFARAAAIFASQQGLARRSSFVLVVDGMWGGYAPIRQARQFIRSQLLNTRFTMANLFHWQRRLPPPALRVAVHVRMGDFRKAQGSVDYRGAFDKIVPLPWYEGVCNCIQRHFGDRAKFLLLSDGHPNDLAEIVDRFQMETGFKQSNSACSDLLMMADADLLVCSTSSYSMAGAFLSDSPYIWFAPNLQEHDGLYSIWGHEPRQRTETGMTSRNMRRVRAMADEGKVEPRGVPVGMDGSVPAALLQRLERRLVERDPASDLIMHGVVPIGISDA